MTNKRVWRDSIFSIYVNMSISIGAMLLLQTTEFNITFKTGAVVVIVATVLSLLVQKIISKTNIHKKVTSFDIAEWAGTLSTFIFSVTIPAFFFFRDSMTLGTVMYFCFLVVVVGGAGIVIMKYFKPSP